MTEGVRRSKRIASIKDALEVTSNPIAASTALKPEKKTISKGKVTKKETKPKSEGGSKGEAAPKLAGKSTKSRSAKKEDAIPLEDEADGEDHVATAELKEGDTLPKNIQLELQNSEKIDLLEYAKKAHILVIFAYPRASTPGCTRQAKGFRDEYEELHGELNASVLGLSADSAKAQTGFKTKQNLPYDLICDTKKTLISLLGCKKQPSGIIRSHFIFVDGVLKVKKVKVSPEDSFTGALKQVRELK